RGVAERQGFGARLHERHRGGPTSRAGQRVGGGIDRDRARARGEQRQVAARATAEIERTAARAAHEPPAPSAEAAALAEAAERVVDPRNLLDPTHRDLVLTATPSPVDATAYGQARIHRRRHRA